MRVSRWAILVVTIAIVAVVIAKQAVKTHPVEQSTSQVAEMPKEPQTPKEEASGGEPVVSPEGSKSGSTAAPPTKEEKAKTSPPAEQVKAKPTGKKPEGPLPGSKLAECLKNGLPTMADFGKGWCVPCKMMKPILEQTAQDYWGKANIVFVELDEYADLGGDYGIITMPTQIFFDAQGKEVKRHMGYMGSEDIGRELAALGVKK